MTFCEYIERIYGKPLNDFQKKWLNTVEKCAKSGCEIYMPSNMGRTLFEQMNDEFKPLRRD